MVSIQFELGKILVFLCFCIVLLRVVCGHKHCDNVRSLTFFYSQENPGPVAGRRGGGGMLEGAMNTLQVWMHPLGICKISNSDMLISTLKRATPYPIHVLPLLATINFQKCMYVQDVLCTGTKRCVELKC